MKYVGAFLMFLACALAQSTIANAAPVFRVVRVDLCLVALIACALGAGTERGLVLGVLAGLAVDVLGGGRVGVGALGYGVVGLLAGSVPETFFPSTALVRVLLLLVASALSSFVLYNALRVYGAAFGYPTEVGRVFLPTALATAVVGTLLLAVVDRFRMGVQRRA